MSLMDVLLGYQIKGQPAPETLRGKFFTACSTSGTPVSGAATSSTDPPNALKGLLHFYNSASRTSGTGKNTLIVPLYIKIRITAAGAGGTSSKFVVGVDRANRIGANTSLATALTAKQTRAGMDSSGAVTQTTSKATIYCGNVTLVAATDYSQHGVVNWRNDNAAFVVGDEITIAFGETFQSGIAVPTIQDLKASFGLAPLVLEPGSSMILQTVIAAQTAASFYEFQVHWFEGNNGSVA